MSLDSLSPIANHLWQSAAFGCGAGLLTLALRKNPARVRHRIWVVASLKFLVPFSLLIALGARVPWHKASVPASVSFPVVLDQVSRPFATPVNSFPGPGVASDASVLPIVLWAVWACGFLCVAFSSWRRWRRVVAAVRAGSPVQVGLRIPAVSSPSFLEPGVFGVFRPVLLLPDGILEQLSPEQWKSVVTHELCHVRHRDNLIGAIQMFIEALFWFHPMVWWIGRRICHEREQGCDEEVLQMGSEPRVYAQGILKVCELYLESPVACVAGVSGSNLRKRIEGILHGRAIRNLSWRGKVLIGCAAAVALGIPVVAGFAQSALGPVSPVPKFEVVSIKSCKAAVTKGGMIGDDSAPGRLSIRCALLADMDSVGLIQVAYNRYAGGRLNSFQVIPIEGGPAWIHSETFGIEATSGGHPSVQMMEGPMMQAVLEDRFKLRIHRETRQRPVYELTLGKGYPKLKPLGKSGCVAVVAGRPSPQLGPGQKYCRNMVSPRGTVDMEGGTFSALAGMLGMALDRPVIDRTGVTDSFEIHLRFSPDDSGAGGATAADPGAFPGIVEAVQEQLGLKLAPAKGPVDVLVIDHVERPSGN